MTDVAGSVKWFDPKKGYGFLRRDGGPDVFIHTKHLMACKIFRPLQKDEKVYFSSKTTTRGFEVVSITLPGVGGQQ